MHSTLERFKRRALAQSDVQAAYDELEEEFSFLKQILAARENAGLTQAQVAERIGTTQSAIARLESGTQKHSPSIATLQRYARALGCRLDVRLVRDRSSPERRKKPITQGRRSPGRLGGNLA
jgi:transcriptional regulator with XRE-family HTH domain